MKNLLMRWRRCLYDQSPHVLLPYRRHLVAVLSQHHEAAKAQRWIFVWYRGGFIVRSARSSPGWTLERGWE